MIKYKSIMMNIIFKLAILLSLSLSLNVSAASDFDAAWMAADELRQQTASLRNEWRDTEKILAQAKAQQTAGNKESAMALIAKAHEQATDAIAQAKREKAAWQSRVIK